MKNRIINKEGMRMEILFAIAFLLVMGVIVFVIQYWWLILLFALQIIIIAIIYSI